MNVASNRSYLFASWTAILAAALIYCHVSLRVRAFEMELRGGACDSEPRCFCISNKNDFVVHCEGELNLKMVYQYLSVTIKCNHTTPSSSLDLDYFSLLKLQFSKPNKLILLGCPEPIGSYAEILSRNQSMPTQNGTKNEPKSGTMELDICCGERKNFSILRKHLDGLTDLIYLKISCRVLSYLPSDLFRDTTPKLTFLQMSNTRVEHIPDAFFSRLPKLGFLRLTGNLVRTLTKGMFSEDGYLEKLDAVENRLNLLSDDLFDSLEHMVWLNLSYNYLTALPVSLRRAKNLELLDLRHNSLEKVDLSDCSNFNNLQSLYLMHNRIKVFDPRCFNFMERIEHFDISGNFIPRLTDHPLEIDGIDTFVFDDNSGGFLELRKFIVSRFLKYLSMRNSSIRSLDSDVLHGLPGLRKIDLSLNFFTFIPEDFFSRNPNLGYVGLRGNSLSTLPSDAFKNNLQLWELDLSFNIITYLNSSLIYNSTDLTALDVSGNALEVIPENFLSNLTSLRTLNLSKNNISSIDKDLFIHVGEVRYLDLSHNRIYRFPKDVFLPFKSKLGPVTLNLSRNRLVSLPSMDFRQLKYLNLAGNYLRTFPADSFHSLPLLMQLNLSRNFIKELPAMQIIKTGQKLQSLDLSFNRLTAISDNSFIEAKDLRFLDLSENRMKNFYWEWIAGASSLREINLSGNGLSFVGVHSQAYYRRALLMSCAGLVCDELLRSCPIKIMNLSNNNLNFNYTQWKFNEVTRTWGKESPLIYCRDAEVLILSNNSIDSIFLDWRIMFPRLKLLDLSKNVIKYLHHQDLLFSTAEVHENGTIDPYHCSHSLTVDLRENLISGVELPTSMLRPTSPRDGNWRRHGPATILLDNNPFACGCAVFDFLRVVENNVFLTSETQRLYGSNLVMPAKIEIGNLSCWVPELIRGKKLSETETWIHHLLPLLGMCSLVPEP